MSIATISEADILARAIDPAKPDLSVDAALSLCRIDFAPEDHERMRDLTKKARQGTLAEEEQDALEKYETVNNLLGILRSKARRSLKAAGQESA